MSGPAGPGLQGSHVKYKKLLTCSCRGVYSAQPTNVSGYSIRGAPTELTHSTHHTLFEGLIIYQLEFSLLMIGFMSLLSFSEIDIVASGALSSSQAV